jgi:transglutaminase-like putative cysteine protease
MSPGPAGAFLARVLIKANETRKLAMPIYEVRHETVYRYRQPVAPGEHRMMLSPREGRDQRLLAAELNITPEPASLRWSYDSFGNRIAAARFSGRTHELRFASFVRVEQSDSHPGGFNLGDGAQTFPVALDPGELPDLLPYQERGHADPDGTLDAWAKCFLRAGRATPTLDLLVAMNEAIRRDFTYVRRTEHGIQAPHETLAAGAGTCRDFAVLMMEAARALGLPARFVSGYLYVPSRDSHLIHGGGATHAWAQIYLPGAGWIDFDPTNATVGNHGLIRVAVTREPGQAVPLFGSYTGFRSDDLGMTVTVKVTRDAGAMEPRASLRA